MNYESKQAWIEAVMADSNLTPATARYAFGIFKHMFGTKDESFPGAKKIAEATGLNDGHFYKYNKALIEAGYLEVTSRRGTSNIYRLTLPTSNGGNHLPPVAVGVPRVEVTPTSSGGTNTTSNTTTKTTKSKTSKSASAPVDSSLKEDTFQSILTQSPSFEEIVTPLLQDARFSLKESTYPAPNPEQTRKDEAEKREREEQEAHARRVSALTELGIDLEGEW